MRNLIKSKVAMFCLMLFVTAPVMFINAFQNRITPSAYEEAVYYRVTLPAVVRSAPTTSSKIICTKSPGEKVQTISVENGWLKFAIDVSSVGYISLDCVEEYIPPEPTELNNDEASVLAAQTVFEMYNQYRVELGLNPLLWNDELYAAALTRAKENTVLKGHVRPDGRRCATAVWDLGINYVRTGENLARYANSNDALYNAWLNSPGHRQAIEMPYWRQGAISIYVDENGYWFSAFIFTV